MARTSPPSFAMNDPAMALVAVFQLLPKARAAERPKLDLEQHFDGTTIRWRAPDVLSISDQTVWLTLAALAAIERAQLTRDTRGEAEMELRSRLQLQGWSLDERAALIACSWSELARVCGLRSTDIRTLKQLQATVRRLAEVTVWCERGGLTTSTRLLAWLIGDDQRVHIALNWRLARILFGNAQYARVCLEERRLLASDAARALHAWLSAVLREGRDGRFALDVLAARVFGDSGTGAKARDRRRRIRGALQEVGRLAGWTVLESGRIATVSRAPRENAHASRENAHAAGGVTPCTDADLGDSQTPLLRGSTNRVEGIPASGGLRRLEAPPQSYPRSPRMGGDRQGASR